jgi:4'-phosphopantetheinyl transferase
LIVPKNHVLPGNGLALMTMHTPVWLDTLPQSALKAGCVHIWLVDLNQAESAMKLQESILSRDEAERAAHFGFEQHRRRFITSRAMLRRLLGHYLAKAPVDVRFQYGHRGKPALSDSSSPRLFFNLAHSHDVALYAFSIGMDLGIDVEYMRQITDPSKLVSDCFSPNEISSYQSLAHPQEKRLAFFRGWTRKEAFLKAIGEGLGIAPDQVEVTLGTQETAQFLKLPVLFQPATSWQLVDLKLDPDYCGALAIQGDVLNISYLRWTEGIDARYSSRTRAFL